MNALIVALANLARFLRNAAALATRLRPPDFVRLPVSGSLPELEPSSRGLLRRRLDPRPTAPSLEGIRTRLDRILADGRPAGGRSVNQPIPSQATNRNASAAMSRRAIGAAEIWSSRFMTRH